MLFCFAAVREIKPATKKKVKVNCNEISDHSTPRVTRETLYKQPQNICNPFFLGGGLVGPFQQIRAPPKAPNFLSLRPSKVFCAEYGGFGQPTPT